MCINNDATSHRTFNDQSQGKRNFFSTWCQNNIPLTYITIQIKNVRNIFEKKDNYNKPRRWFTAKNKKLLQLLN